MSLGNERSIQFDQTQFLPDYARKQTDRQDTWQRYDNKSPMVNTPNIHCKGAYSCTCHKGSYTLEAAVILPIMAGFFVAILFFFRVLQIQTGVQEALCYASRKTACAASTVESSAALHAWAETYFRTELKQYEYIDQYVAGGGWGISILRSDVSENEVNLKADYYIKLPINFFGGRGIAISQTSSSRKWTGDRDNEVLEDYVYVTKNGSVYHCCRDCSYLDLSIQPVDIGSVSALRNKDGHIYYACSDCVAKNSTTSITYITDYGTCYHSNLACPGLKRSIYMIPMSEVGGRRACSKCGNQSSQ